MVSFSLSYTLAGHDGDVRAISTGNHPTEQSIITGSRDRTSRLWIKSGDGHSYSEGLCMRGHEQFVTSLCVLPPSDKFPQGLIVSGSNDFSINAYTLDSVLPVYTLKAHVNTVCCLSAGKFGTLISGSWDTTAKVWLNEKNVMTLKGHTAGVWAVAILPTNGIMLTGSADKTIKTWRAGKCELTLTGHSDCVRALAILSDAEFLSCSNDATIRRWTITGECIHEYKGHTSFIYSIALLPNGQDFVTCGEDRSVRIWRDGQCCQTITLPAQSAWCVTSLPNGDIAVGSSDNMARVFTMDPGRVASADEQELFDQQVASSVIPVQSSDLGGIKPEDLPGKEDLTNPGKKDGQTKLIRVDANVEAYSWSNSEMKWTKIGDVVGSKDGKQTGGEKVVYEGKEYDYVFSVDMEEGRPPLKLPYNVSDDPWHVAQQFIHTHELDQVYLEQIANFIMQNTASVTLGTATPKFTDPYTGGGRYIPGGNTTRQEPTATVNGVDPFTGGTRHIPPSTTPAPTASERSHYFPKSSFITFDTGNIPQIIGKLSEFNEKLDHKLDAAAIDQLKSLAESSTHPHVTPTMSQMDILWRALKWPKDIVFPVLDILRLSIRHPFVNQHFCNEKDGTHFLAHLQEIASPDSKHANKMLVFRILCNAFQCKPGASLLRDNCDNLIALLVDCKSISNKNLQIALATVVLNYCVQLHQSQDVEVKLLLLSAISTILEVQDEDEAHFRLLVALGTLIGGDDNSASAANSLGIKPIIKQLTQEMHTQKVTECAQNIMELLQ